MIRVVLLATALWFFALPPFAFTSPRFIPLGNGLILDTECEQLDRWDVGFGLPDACVLRPA